MVTTPPFWTDWLKSGIVATYCTLDGHSLPCGCLGPLATVLLLLDNWSGSRSNNTALCPGNTSSKSWTSTQNRSLCAFLRWSESGVSMPLAESWPILFSNFLRFCSLRKWYRGLCLRFCLLGDHKLKTISKWIVMLGLGCLNESQFGRAI